MDGLHTYVNALKEHKTIVTKLEKKKKRLEALVEYRETARQKLQGS